MSTDSKKPLATTRIFFYFVLSGYGTAISAAAAAAAAEAAVMIPLSFIVVVITINTLFDTLMAINAVCLSVSLSVYMSVP